jgi:DNA-binding CsgD family transcriptional regulator
MLESISRADSDIPAALSPRELQVLEMTSRGLTNTEVGAQLSVSVHAVKFHLGSIYRKLGVSNRTEAAVVYLRGRSLSEEQAARGG